MKPTATGTLRYTDAQLLQILRALRLVVFDFDGVFTDNHVYVTEDGREMVRCSRLDGFGLRRLEEAGLETFILSKETNEVVQARAKKLRVTCVHGVDDKLAYLNHELRAKQIGWSEVCYVGNDINDVPCMDMVGFAVAVNDAYPSVFPHSHFTTARPGGSGAVREVCEYLVEQRSRTES